MKKVLLSIVAVVMFAVAANAQGNIETQAKKEAKDAGCLGDYKGQLTTSTNVIGGCAIDLATTGVWSEVYVAGPSSPNVRVAAFARVEFCGNQVVSVTCVLQ